MGVKRGPHDSFVSLTKGTPVIILASASPRRKDILAELGLDLAISPSDIDERRRENETPTELVERLAREKALACYENTGNMGSQDVVIAADTIVWLEDEVLGKPRSVSDAKAMLMRLSGAEHSVSTGVCLVLKGKDAEPVVHSFVETTHVRFYELSQEEVDSYIATGEAMDKAGAYGIQGQARLFVRAINGDYYNVVGLPVARTIRELAALSPAFALLPESLMRQSHC